VTHEERLRAMSDTLVTTNDYRAACRAGAEALRLLREYQEATAAYERACGANYNIGDARSAMEAAERALLATEVTR